MRVVAGELRGRKIEAPEGKTTRPTTDKAREATFNALGSAGVIIDAHVVDAFAGSGALGIEALSRGAAHCTFIERDRDALEVLKRNIDTLGLTDRATIVRGDAMQQLAAVKGATLIGDGPTAMGQIRAIGNDMALDPGIGNCGKAGQWVPVGVGQPTLMIGGLTVGGASS